MEAKKTTGAGPTPRTEYEVVKTFVGDYGNTDAGRDGSLGEQTEAVYKLWDQMSDLLRECDEVRCSHCGHQKEASA